MDMEERRPRLDFSAALATAANYKGKAAQPASAEEVAAMLREIGITDPSQVEFLPQAQAAGAGSATESIADTTKKEGVLSREIPYAIQIKEIARITGLSIEAIQAAAPNLVSSEKDIKNSQE